MLVGASSYERTTISTRIGGIDQLPDCWWKIFFEAAAKRGNVKPMHNEMSVAERGQVTLVAENAERGHVTLANFNRISAE